MQVRPSERQARYANYTERNIQQRIEQRGYRYAKPGTSGRSLHPVSPFDQFGSSLPPYQPDARSQELLFQSRILSAGPRDRDDADFESQLPPERMQPSMSLVDAGQVLPLLPERYQQRASYFPEEITPPRPAGQGMMIWTDQNVALSVGYGQRLGAFDSGTSGLKRAAAELATGPIETRRIASALEQAGVPAGPTSAILLRGAARYLREAPVETRGMRAEQTLLALKAASTVGTPPITREQMLVDLHERHEVPPSALRMQPAELREIYDTIGAAEVMPGENAVQLAGRYHMEFKNDPNGNKISAEVKKQSSGFFKTALGIAFNVMSFIPVTAVIGQIGSAALSAYNAVKQKNWVGAIGAVASGFGAGALGAAAKGATGVATTAQKLANTFSTAADYAGKIATGVNAVRAIKEGNWMGALMPGVSALGSSTAGALSKSFGALGDSASRVASWLERGETTLRTYQAIKRGDLASAVDSGLDLASVFKGS